MDHWYSLYIEITAFLGLLLLSLTIPWALTIKKDPSSAVAWCLLIFFLPILGSLLFFVLGYQHVQKPLSRKRRHKKRFQLAAPGPLDGPEHAPDDKSQGHDLARLGERFGAFGPTLGNDLEFYFEGEAPFAQILREIGAANHHIHLEYFIIQPDKTGCALLDALEKKARAGVEVRLLYDAMGSRRLSPRLLRPLLAAGGKCSAFLPLNPLRKRIQVNMRDHRKILVVDGKVAYTGGLNIGDEYLGKMPRFGFWRDTHLRVQGPAVTDLQRLFVESWDFAALEKLQGAKYFPRLDAGGPYEVQVIQSGPDQETRSIREIYFAAILKARKRLWIASPYFVPDVGLLDALCLTAYMGVDVRLLLQYHPDKWIPFFAGRYLWNEIFDAGVKVYQYARGMMHSKVILVDDEFASVGTANFDNRSLHLNFEVNCLIYSTLAVAKLDAALRQDFEDSIRVDADVFAQRPLSGRLLENACRLLSPVL